MAAGSVSRTVAPPPREGHGDLTSKPPPPDRLVTVMGACLRAPQHR